MSDFDERHGPGSRILTASNWPCLLAPPEERPRWAPSPIALAAHMLGREPLPVPGKEARRGKLLEGTALQLAAEDYEFEIVQTQPWCPHRELQAGATPDATGRLNGAVAVLEVKVVDLHTFRERWAEWPPLWYRLQVQAQLACAGYDVGYIGALVIEWGDINFHLFEERRLDPLVGLLESRAAAFLDLLEHDRLPEPDLSESAYRTLQKLLPLEAGRTIHVPGQEATERLQRWRNARATRLAAEKEEKAAQHWFATVAEDATKITVDGSDTPLKRSLVKETTVPEHTKSAYWRWSP